MGDFSWLQLVSSGFWSFQIILRFSKYSLFTGVTSFLLNILDLKILIQKEKHMPFYGYWLLENIARRKWGTGKN